MVAGGGNSSGRSSPNEDPAAAKLFVGGLSWQTSPEKLKEYFGMFGTVTDVLIMKDPLTQVHILSDLTADLQVVCFITSIKGPTRLRMDFKLNTSESTLLKTSNECILKQYD